MISLCSRRFPFYFVLVSFSVSVALSTVFYFINSPNNCLLSRSCSSGLNSAILVISAMYLFKKVTLSPYIILCG